MSVLNGAVKTNNLEIQAMILWLGWCPPDCPDCGTPMELEDFEIKRVDYDGVSDATARFFCPNEKRAIGHFVSMYEMSVCTRCKQSPVGPCPKDEPNTHPQLKFIRMSGQDYITVSIERYP